MACLIYVKDFFTQLKLGRIVVFEYNGFYAYPATLPLSPKEGDRGRIHQSIRDDGF